MDWEGKINIGEEWDLLCSLLHVGEDREEGTQLASNPFPFWIYLAVLEKIKVQTRKPGFKAGIQSHMGGMQVQYTVSFPD